MASTDTRSGFRLPWSSDRSQDENAFQVDANGDPDSPAASAKPSVAWPESDFASRAGIEPAQPRPADAPETPEASASPASPEEAPTVVSQPPAARSKKSTKLMAELATAIRTTAESARDQQLAQLATEANGIIETIRAQSEEGAVALRRKSDEDISGIRDWAKAEIARIKEESESRIGDRKHLLEQEIADHAAAIEDRCAEVESTVAGFREAMEAYFERLGAEDDPARLATMAESMPEPPSLKELSDLDDLPIEGAAARHAAAEAQDAAAEAEAEAEAEVISEAVAEDPHVTDEIVISDDRIAHALGYGDDAAMADEAEPGEVEHHAEGVAAESEADAGEAWAADGDDVPRWAAGEVPEGFPTSGEPGEPVDRGSIMAALEAAAEAVVAAEAAAESADTAEAAADVAETAAELVAGRTSQRSEEADPEAQAALSARVNAGGFDTESYQDRLASLLPGHAEGDISGEPRTSQVVVTGLVSVASIASFKRHLGRLSGVTAVAVSSGPDGEFIFNVTHRPDVSFRDAIPTMPGFAARVVATGDGVVSVTAHDPEAEG
jgi:hypothetical protein